VEALPRSLLPQAPLPSVRPVRPGRVGLGIGGRQPVP
jgi:hypothetical protein